MGGPVVDIAIRDRKIVAIGKKLQAVGQELDGRGKCIIPGLIDHHIHLLATAAKLDSLDLTGIIDRDTIVRKLREYALRIEIEKPIRAIGYDERAAGIPDVAELTRWLPDRPLRIQDRTGALWILNQPMLDQLGSSPFPDCVERSANGILTGRIWRGDSWLRSVLGSDLPPVAAISKHLAGFGITGVTDAGPSNGVSEGKLFEQLCKDGQIVQKLHLMGNETLPVSKIYQRGPVKLHYDERDLPPLDEVAKRIAQSRLQGRAVGAHCVTEGELAFYLAALDAAGGARNGDRIEHGSIISSGMIEEIARRQLTVVTQPAFIIDRGERYIDTVDECEWKNLYRLRSLLESGISLAAGSDSPYGSINPWHAIQSARDRITQNSQIIGQTEALGVDQALRLYLRPLNLSYPGIRKIAIGEQADLCLLNRDWQEVIRDPNAKSVRVTMVDGKIIHICD